MPVYLRDGYGITFPKSVMPLGCRESPLSLAPTALGDLLKPQLKGKLGLYNLFYMFLYAFVGMKVAAAGKTGHCGSAVVVSMALLPCRTQDEPAKNSSPSQDSPVDSLATGSHNAAHA